MKTKQLFIALICIFSFYGQVEAQTNTKQSPTLNETVDWIIKYLCANGDRMYFSYEDYPVYSNITFDTNTKILSFTNGSYIIEMTVSKLTSIKNGKLDSDKFFAKVIYIDHPDSDRNITSRSVSITLKNDDYTKLDKAFKHLAELCGAKLLNEDLF